MDFTFPELEDDVWKEQLSRTHSIRDFQVNFVYQSIQRVLEKKFRRTLLLVLRN